MAQESLGRILVVDDELDLAEALQQNLTRQGYDVTAMTSAQEALPLLAKDNIDLLLSDMMMPGMGGIELLQEALALDPQLVGIIMTGQATVQTAVEAMKIGAFDYLLKPFKLEHILPVLTRAMAVRRLRMENVRLRDYVASLTFESNRYQIIGRSPAIQRLMQLIQKVAPTDATVLIRGATGTGKELGGSCLASQ